MKKPTRVIAGIAMSALCLMGLLAGCGGSSKKTTPTTAAPSTPAAAAGTSTPPTAGSRTLGSATTAGPTASSSSVGAPTTYIASASAPTVPSSRPEPIDTQIEVYGDCMTPRLEPTEIILSCADGGWVLEHLHWSRWTASEATAVGTFIYNDCHPYCAAGHFHAVPGTQVTLTAPVHGTGGQLVWSHLTQSPEPPGYATGPLHGGPFPLPTRPI